MPMVTVICGVLVANFANFTNSANLLQVVIGRGA